MNNNKQLLKEAAKEIHLLRNENKLMSARLEMFDSIMHMFHTQPSQVSHGMKVDIVYELDKAVAEIEYNESVKAI